jgi:hypothetical protein
MHDYCQEYFQKKVLRRLGLVYIPVFSSYYKLIKGKEGPYPLG